MPRTRLDKLVGDNPISSRKSKPMNEEPTIGGDLAPAIVLPNLPVNTIPEGRLKKLAGTPFLVDVDTGLVYLEPTILKALKNN